MLVRERPIKRASSYLAKSVAAWIEDFPPVALDGLTDVWCVTGSCGGDFMLVNIIETVQPTNDR